MRSGEINLPGDKVRDDLSVYANYSESLAPTSPRVNLLNEAELQRGTQYEAGIKYSPVFPKETLFTLAVFDLTLTNVPHEVSPGLYDQIGEVRVRGIELEGKLALADQLSATLSYSCWNPETLEDGISGNAGNEPQQVPNLVGSVWAESTFPGDGLRGDLTVGAGVRYAGSSCADNANTLKIDAHTVVDDAISYEFFENATLQLNASSLFDEECVSNVDTSSNTAYYGDGRTVRATFRYTW